MDNNINNINKEDELNDNEILLYILNENNIYITESHIEKILKENNVNHKINNLTLFQEALTHSSYVERDLKNDRIVKLIKEKNLEKIDEKLITKAIPLQKKSYERLEFLGDSILHLILAEYLFNRYPEEQEGFMTRLRTKIENGETLSNLSIKLGFNKFALIARNMDINIREKNNNIFEDCLEAFLGALFTETNYDICKKFIVSLIEREVDFSELLYKENNFKDLLLQYYHVQKWDDPEYGLDEALEYEEENKTKKLFKMYVKGYTTNKNGEIIWTKVGFGSGSSKKKGEQMAAKNALKYLNAYNENSDDDDEIEI